MTGHELFDCIGLLTVFPAVFGAIGLVSGAIGFRRFTTVDAPAGPNRRVLGFRTERVSLGGDGAESPRRNKVIDLPGRTNDAPDVPISGNGDDGDA
jgi:hypothetical protein